MAKLNLQTPTSRGRLAPRDKPYAIRLIPGVWLGYRAARSGTGAWLVIAADGKGGRWQKVFGHADDKQPTDGVAVFDYEQAANKARALARGDANAAADRPVSISEAITAYEADLTARGRVAYNARWVAHHLPRHLAAQPLSQATSKQLRSWRDGLIKAGMLPATVNRVLKPAHAAFNLAGKLDARVAANAQAWKVGLEALHGTVKAREAVLSDQQVQAAVAAAYDISEQFGLYVQAHAELGARSSQIARCTIGDLLPVDRHTRRCWYVRTGRHGNRRRPITDAHLRRPRARPGCQPIRRSTACDTRRSCGRYGRTCRSRSWPTGTTPRPRSSRNTTRSSSRTTPTI